MSYYNSSNYLPSFFKHVSEGGKSVSLTLNDITGSNFENVNSFGYDPDGSGLKSTQQLNVDWTKFENHTFFMSAEAKVNLAFEQIINNYPFDGNRQEIENFFTNLTGFDKWVFDRFPKYKGQLHFSGTQIGENPSNGYASKLGTWIGVKDIQGALFPALSPNANAQTSVLNPKNGKSLSIELHLKVPEILTNGTQVLLQKIDSGYNHGFSICLNSLASTTQGEIQFDVFSGSSGLTATTKINKGTFNHLCFVFDRNSKIGNIKIYNNESLVSQSDKKSQINDLEINSSDLIIGSGSQYYVNGVLINPQQTLSASIDELRIFHSVRTLEQQKLYAKKSIYSTEDLKLYYKFNEPPPPLSPISGDITNSIILDSSGNSLHSYITNFLAVLREDATQDNKSKMTYERNDMSPVLFPAQQDVVSLNVELLTSASSYDLENPNLITRLIPRHYLTEGAQSEGLSFAEENNNEPYSGNGIPGQGQINNVQVLLSLLYIWAKFFDEIKLFLDAFSTLRTVDYDINQSIPNNLLFDVAKHYGFYIPPIFNNSTIEQYLFAENIDPLIKGNESLSIRSIQHEILRRILINLPAVIRSKGTQHSIKAFLRAVGIDPDSSMRFREYGGPNYRKLQNPRDLKSDITGIVTFISSSLVVSNYLSGSRIEPGYPKPQGTFVLAKTSDFGYHGISNSKNDGLFTSGSWTFECDYKYNLLTVPLLSTTQSLARMCVTGSMFYHSPGIVANLVAYYDKLPKLTLFLRPGNADAAPLFKLTLNLPKDTLFNGDIWNVSFGCDRNDSINSIASSSYFIRAGTQNENDVLYYTTSSYFYELDSTVPEQVTNLNVFRSLDQTNNTNSSGSFICIGSNQNFKTFANANFLNNTDFATDSAARSSAFDGRAMKLRFWSKGLSEAEWIEHVRNYQSVGVNDPLTNFNYEKVASGSFEKLRLDSLTKQQIKKADVLGSIVFLDFSENKMDLSGSGFPTDVNCITPEIIRYTHLSPYFDEPITNEKIRVRGYNDEKLISQNLWASKTPVYEILRSEPPQDDVRFSIDFSLVDSLNRDIINMFSSFDELSNYIGRPELLFSPDYPDLEKLRNLYFNKLKTKLNFKAFMEFYSWFDSSISVFIQQLIPRKTFFKGSNFIIESHMLERNKHEYYYSDMYKIQSKIKPNLIVFDFKPKKY